MQSPHFSKSFQKILSFQTFFSILQTSTQSKFSTATELAFAICLSAMKILTSNLSYKLSKDPESAVGSRMISITIKISKTLKSMSTRLVVNGPTNIAPSLDSIKPLMMSSHWDLSKFHFHSGLIIAREYLETIFLQTILCRPTSTMEDLKFKVKTFSLQMLVRIPGNGLAWGKSITPNSNIKCKQAISIALIVAIVSTFTLQMTHNLRLWPRFRMKLLLLLLHGFQRQILSANNQRSLWFKLHHSKLQNSSCSDHDYLF